MTIAKPLGEISKSIPAAALRGDLGAAGASICSSRCRRFEIQPLSLAKVRTSCPRARCVSPSSSPPFPQGSDFAPRCAKASAFLASATCFTSEWPEVSGNTVLAHIASSAFRFMQVCSGRRRLMSVMLVLGSGNHYQRTSPCRAKLQA